MPKNNKKEGFTLVEIIVTLAITGIVGIFLVGFTKNQLNYYTNFIETNNAKTVSTAIFNVLQNDIQKGSDFNISDDRLSFTIYERSDDASSILEKEIEISSNLEEIDGNTIPLYFKDIIPPNRGYLVTVKFEADTINKTITPTVSISKDGNKLYTLKQSIYCLQY